jgi:hypothetical protein
MKGPRCRICDHEHWSYDPHVFPDEPVTKPVHSVTKPVPVAPVVTKPEPVMKRKVGRPPKYATRAEQQAAYRKRKAGNA